MTHRIINLIEGVATNSEQKMMASYEEDYDRAEALRETVQLQMNELGNIFLALLKTAAAASDALQAPGPGTTTALVMQLELLTEAGVLAGGLVLDRTTGRMRPLAPEA